MDASRTGQRKISEGFVVASCSTGGGDGNGACSTDLEPCAAGRYVPPGDSVCRDCPEGWGSYAAAVSCQICESGKFSAGNGMDCRTCSADVGNYSDRAGSTSCKQCRLGTISVGSKCVDLQEDTDMALSFDVTLHVDSSASHEVAVSWSSTDRAIDSYILQWDRDARFSSPNQSSVSWDSRSSEYTVTVQLPTAVVQWPFYFRVRAKKGASASPWSAIAGNWKSLGEDACEDRLMYLNESSSHPANWKCSRCPSGAVCPGSILWGSVVAETGYWRKQKIWSRSRREAGDATFIKCLERKACLGADPGALAGELQSAAETEGCNPDEGYLRVCDETSNRTCRICFTCRPGFAKGVNFQRCERCEENTRNVAGIAALLCATVLVFGLLVFFRIRGAMRSQNLSVMKVHTTLKRQLFTHMQVMCMVSGLNLPWPASFWEMIRAFETVSTATGHISLVTCEYAAKTLQAVRVEADMLYLQSTVILCMPVAATAALFLYWVVLSPRCPLLSCRYRLRPSRICAVSRFNPCRQTSLRRQRAASLQSDRVTTRDAWIMSLSYLLYLCYPSLCSYPFRLLNCRTIGGVPYLARDVEEPCWEGRHLVYAVGVAIPGLLGFGLGLPLLCLLVMWRRRKKLYTNKYIFRLGLIYNGYRKPRFFWEIFIASRKLSIIMIASLISEEVLQLQVCLSLIFVLILLHVTFFPYDIRSPDGRLLHHMEMFSLSALFLVVWFGTAFSASAGGCKTDLCAAVQGVGTVAIIALNVAFLCMSLGFLLKFYILRTRVGIAIARSFSLRKLKQRSAREEQQMDPGKRNRGQYSFTNSSAVDNPMKELELQFVRNSRLHSTEPVGTAASGNLASRDAFAGKDSDSGKESSDSIDKQMPRTFPAHDSGGSASCDSNPSQPSSSSAETGNVNSRSGTGQEWTEYWDPTTSQPYYCNSRTGECMWELPKTFRRRK